VPNTEFGHMELRGRDAETWASDFVRQNRDLSWKKWGKRFNIYLNEMEKLFWPDLFILGGGVSKKFSKFSKFLHTRAEVCPAQMRNNAGIIGAALAIEPKVLSNGKG
jgi:polyphosphate glucokinase